MFCIYTTVLEYTSVLCSVHTILTRLTDQMLIRIARVATNCTENVSYFSFSFETENRESSKELLNVPTVKEQQLTDQLIA